MEKRSFENNNKSIKKARLDHMIIQQFFDHKEATLLKIKLPLYDKYTTKFFGRLKKLCNLQVVFVTGKLRQPA